MGELGTLQAALADVWSDIDALVTGDRTAFEHRLLAVLRSAEAAPGDGTRLDAVYAALETQPALYDRLLQTMGDDVVAYRGTSLATRAPGARYVRVPVWYATDRAATGSEAPAAWFSGDRGTLVHGCLEVSIPDTHEKGRLETPSLWRLQFRASPDRHVILQSVAPAPEAAWQADLRAALARCTRRDVLLFIHGYNVDFETAARRAAQFAYDLEFTGACVLYSWPSEGRTLKYTVDEDNALWTVDHFEEVLAVLLTGLDAACVHAVAHSMGSRVLAEGVRRLDVTALPAGAARLREVVFAAPDINADTFRTFVRKFGSRAERFTLYASSGDRALACSHTVHKYPRAGDAGPDLVIVDGLETVDASAIDDAWLGHSYFCENRAVIQDLARLILDGQGCAAPRWGLHERVAGAGRYWAMVR